VSALLQVQERLGLVPVFGTIEPVEEGNREEPAVLPFGVPGGNIARVAKMRGFVMSIRPVGLSILGFCCLTLLSSDTHARPVEPWPFEKLFKESTLVVVVKPRSVRNATAQDMAMWGKKLLSKDDRMIAAIVTSFRVLLVVKGEYKEKNLDILHFKYKPGMGIRNGPAFISFTEYISDDTPPDFLVFLKKDKAGNWAFVSGQVDPGLSVTRGR
jgi:hypothetical protein